MRILVVFLMVFGFVFSSELDSLVKKCDDGDGRACLRAAVLYDRLEKDTQKRGEFQLPLLQKSCDLGEGMGCYNLAASYQVDGDIIKAREIFDKSCNVLKHAISCKHLAFMYEDITKKYGHIIKKDLKKAKYYHKKACKLGYKPSCGYAKEL